MHAIDPLQISRLQKHYICGDNDNHLDVYYYTFCVEILKKIGCYGNIFIVTFLTVKV